MTAPQHYSATHHDYRDIPMGDKFENDIPLLANKTAHVTGKVSRTALVIYDIPYSFKIDDNETASAERPSVESVMLAALLNGFPD